MYIITASSTKENYKEAISEIVDEVNRQDFKPQQMLYFLSMNYPQESTAQEIKSQFNDCECFGITSGGGEYYDDKFYEHSITCMFFGENVFEDIQCLTIDFSDYMQSMTLIRGDLYKYFGKVDLQQESDKYFALSLVNIASQQFIDRLDDFIEKFPSYLNITSLGGVSTAVGDDKTDSCIHINGKIYTNHIAMIFIKYCAKFDIIFTHNHLPTNQMLTPTVFGKNRRIVKEFNNMPAIDAYAQAIGIDKKHINHINQEVFQKYTLAYEPALDCLFTVQIKQVLPDGSLEFYARIQSYSEYNVMSTGDIWFETKKALLRKFENDKVEDKYNKLIGVVEFTCVSRTNALKQENRMEHLTKLFDFVPHIGISSMGEIYMSLVSYTSVLLFLYEPD